MRFKDTASSRNGNKVEAYKLTIRGTVEMDRQSNSVFNNLENSTRYFRWIIYIDTQCNGSTPGLSDLFEELPNNLDQFDVYNSLYETGRFKILMDKFIRVSEITAVYDGTNYHIPSRIVHFKKTFTMNLPITYGDHYANLTSVRTNNIGMIIFSGQSTTSQLSVSFRTRLRYTDI